MPQSFETVLCIAMGVALAAACGFRVFVPLLVVSIAAKSGHVQLGAGFEWMGQWPALLTFAVATGLEIGAYYIPWLDNLLDTIASPAAVVAGTIVSASFITGVDPTMKWVLAAVAGGGSAAAVQAVTVGARAVTVATTGGLANPVVSTGEWVGAAGLSLLAIIVPIVTLLLMLGLVVMLGLWVVLRRRGRNVPVVTTCAAINPPTAAPSPTLPA